jgi:hypothetical protein
MAKSPRKSNEEETSAEQWAREARASARTTAKSDPAALKYQHDQRMKIAQEWASLPADYPLELVANIASRLLRDEDYADAVCRALRLLQVCDQTQKTIKDRKELLQLEAATGNDDFEYPEGLFRMSYGEAIKFITGQRRHDRAEEDYLVFLEVTKPSQTKSERTNALKSEERDGIDVGMARKLRDHFNELRAQGNLGKRARPSEKFDEQNDSDG